MEDVVAVGGQHQPPHRQPHRPRHAAGIDVPEIARRHAERDGPPRRAQRHRGGEVVHHLRQHPRPVDRVHTGQPHLVREGVVAEHRLHQRLAVVEVAIQGERMDVRLRGAGHLPPLHLAHPPVRVEHVHVHPRQPPKRLHGGRAGVPGGRPHHRHALAGAAQHLGEHAPDQLHGEVLERQRRPVEQLQKPPIGPELPERRPRRVPEGRIGLRNQPPKRRLAEGVPDQRPHHAKRHLLVGLPGQRRDLVRLHDRHRLGHVEPAVARQPRAHRLREAERGRPPAGGYVSHHPSSRRHSRQSQSADIAAQTAASPNHCTA